MRLDAVLEPVEWTRSRALVDIELPRAGAYALTALTARLAAVAASGRLVVLHAPSSVDAAWELEAWLGAIARMPELNPQRVLVAGLDERHLGLALEAGFWAGVAIDAHTGLTADVVAELLDFYGVDGILLDARRAEDLDAVCAAMRQRGHNDATLARLTHENPNAFLAAAQAA